MPKSTWSQLLADEEYKIVMLEFLTHRSLKNYSALRELLPDLTESGKLFYMGRHPGRQMAFEKIDLFDSILKERSIREQRFNCLKNQYTEIVKSSGKDTRRRAKEMLDQAEAYKNEIISQEDTLMDDESLEQNAKKVMALSVNYSVYMPKNMKKLIYQEQALQPHQSQNPEMRA